MSKKLSEMTLQELWQLFPIFLTEHNPSWKKLYKEEAAKIGKLLQCGAKISHIGSTAVSGIMAKPIIDILIEMPSGADIGQAAKALERGGFTVMSETADRISLNKGYTESGFAENVFHVHIRKAGDNAEIAFRDYLIAHPNVAKEYETLKLGLWKKYEHDRDGYTNAKSEFVNKYTALAARAEK